MAGVWWGCRLAIALQDVSMDTYIRVRVLRRAARSTHVWTSPSCAVATISSRRHQGRRGLRRHIHTIYSSILDHQASSSVSSCKPATIPRLRAACTLARIRHVGYVMVGLSNQPGAGQSTVSAVESSFAVMLRKAWTERQLPCPPNPSRRLSGIESAESRDMTRMEGQRATWVAASFVLSIFPVSPANISCLPHGVLRTQVVCMAIIICPWPPLNARQIVAEALRHTRWLGYRESKPSTTQPLSRWS